MTTQPKLRHKRRVLDLELGARLEEKTIMKKIAIAALLATVAAVGALAACGGGTPANGGDLDRATDLAVQNPYYNPRPVTREGVRALLEHAFLGVRPHAEAS